MLNFITYIKEEKCISSSLPLKLRKYKYIHISYIRNHHMTSFTIPPLSLMLFVGTNIFVPHVNYPSEKYSSRNCGGI